MNFRPITISTPHFQQQFVIRAHVCFMHQSCVSTAPPPAGIVTFHFQSPGISPSLWGQADDNTRPTLQKYQGGGGGGGGVWTQITCALCQILLGSPNCLNSL